MAAYYNEIDGFAVAWLRELIKAGLIAPGEVDERDIREVQAADLRGFAQCHFFAGIGVWSYALKQAGWPDDTPVWTGSCPCPPFSSAGKKKVCPECGGANPVPHVGRTGYFVCCLCGHEWVADPRHLWPEMWRLIRDGRPRHFFGEQVAGKDGRVWLASVRASLEILGYAVRAKGLSAAGFGAPHQRLRSYFVADTASYRRGECEISALKTGQSEPRSECSGKLSGRPKRLGATGRMVDAHEATWRGDGTVERDRRAQSVIAAPSEVSRVADASGRRCEQRDSGERAIPESDAHEQAGGLGDTELPGSHGKRESGESQAKGRMRKPERPSGITNGFWVDAEWLYCRDGNYRSVEPSTFPLAHGAANRVGRLRGYGNAFCAPVAEGFIKAYLEKNG